MKKFGSFVALLLVSASLAHANTVDSVFKKDTILPFALRGKVLEALIRYCYPGISPYGLTELQTMIQPGIDPGTSGDQYFATVFDSRYNFDGAHPTHIGMVVHSVVRANEVGDDRFVITNVEGDMCIND